MFLQVPQSIVELRKLLGRPAHAYSPTTETFPELDTDRVAADLDLVARGDQRGRDNLPASGETTLDAVETEIMEAVSAAQKRSHDQLENHLTGFRQRLIDLDFATRFATIHSASQTGLSNLTAELKMGLDDLHPLREDVKEAEQWRADFRRENGLRRPAKRTTAFGTTIKWMIIVLLVLVELIVNGELLSKSNQLGLVGGIIEAIIFAILNIGVALIFAIFLIPNLIHARFWRKLLGFVSLLAYIALAVAINLALAHYREVAATFTSGADRLILERIVENPFGLTEFRSWILFGLGLFFSVVALIDGLALRDVYPGYATVDQRLQKARENYRDERQALISELTEAREGAEADIAEARADLGRQRTEHDAIVANRSRQLVLFATHQDHLEKTANLLLRTYRDANMRARTTPPPAHFGIPFRLDRITVQVVRDGEWNSDELKREITDAQADLDRMLVSLGEQFTRAIGEYRELDVITPGF